MAVHKFTDKWLQSPSIIPSAGRSQFVDALCPGLHLRVTVKGTKTFSVLVRPSGRPQRHTIGTYPRVSLNEARDRALEALRASDRGIMGQGKRSLVRDDLTLQKLVDAYVERHLHAKDLRSADNIAACLGSLIDPKPKPGDKVKRKRKRKQLSRIHKLLPRQVNTICKRDVMDVIDAAVAEGKPQAAVNLLRYMKMLFNWAADQDYMQANPLDRAKSPARTHERDRVLSDVEIAAVWHASFKLMEPYGQMYRMFLLTGQRRCEVSEMKWHEIAGDTWTIPRTRVKMDRLHTVPLTHTAQETLASLPNHGSNAYVFTTTSGEKASSNFMKVKRELHQRSGTSDWTIHDIRRTVRSKLAELGVSREVARKVLNHEDGKVDRIYNRHEYMVEKREALARWESKLIEIAQAHQTTKKPNEHATTLDTHRSFPCNR